MTLTLLFLLLAILLLIATLFLFIPILKFSPTSKSQITSSWYQSRLEELQKEFALDQLNASEYREAETELKLTAKNELVDLQKNNQNGTESTHHYPATNKRGIKWLTLGLFVLVVSVFYWQTGNYRQLAAWQNSISIMPELGRKVLGDASQQVSTKELEDFSLGLRTKLTEKPDPVGWMILGRTLMALNNIDEAVSAFEKSVLLAPESTAYKLDLSQALMQKGGEFELQKAVDILRDILDSQPDNTRALLMFAEAHLIQEKFEIAGQLFTFVKQRLAEDDSRLTAINNRIKYIQQQLQVTDSNIENSDKELFSITINILIEDTLTKDINQFKQLYVFAKTESVAMPIAVRKFAINSQNNGLNRDSFPLKVTLSDDNSMLPNLKLSSFDSIHLFARLSVDDDVPYEQGDWQGQVEKVNLQNTIDTNTQIELKINEEFQP